MTEGPSSPGQARRAVGSVMTEKTISKGLPGEEDRGGILAPSSADASSQAGRMLAVQGYGRLPPSRAHVWGSREYSFAGRTLRTPTLALLKVFRLQHSKVGGQRPKESDSWVPGRCCQLLTHTLKTLGTAKQLLPSLE